MMRWKSAAWVMHLWLRTHVGDRVAPIGIASGTADRADLEGVGRSRRQVVNGHGPRIGEQPGVLPGAGRAASAEGSLRDGNTYCCPDETRIRGGNHRVRHGKTSLLRGNECVRDGNECFDEGNNRVRREEGLVRGAESSVRGGNDLFRLSKNHFRLEQNHFRHGNNCRWRRSRHALDSSGFACEWR